MIQRSSFLEQLLLFSLWLQSLTDQSCAVSESCLNDTINEDQSWFCLIFRNSYNWILRILKKIDTKASIYVMFKDCVKLEKDVFMTWKKDDVNEQDVDERKECWERKRVLSHIWVKSESDLGQISTRSLTSSNHYAEYSLVCTANWLKLQSCSVLSILIHS